RKITLLVAAEQGAAAKAALGEAVALANGMALTKELGNLPGNVCTPTDLATTAKKLAKEFKLGVEVLERKQLEALKMGSFLSVTN
ncbi:leucyl aminopeptidase, partial [Acinetobacter baumannii]